MDDSNEESNFKNIFIVGYMNSNKSTVGNRIVSRNLFKTSSCSPNKSELKTKVDIAEAEVEGLGHIHLIDTPGFCSRWSNRFRKSLKENIDYLPEKINAFLIVVKYENWELIKYKETVKEFKRIFGKEAFSSAIIIANTNNDRIGFMDIDLAIRRHKQTEKINEILEEEARKSTNTDKSNKDQKTSNSDKKSNQTSSLKYVVWNNTKAYPDQVKKLNDLIINNEPREVDYKNLSLLSRIICYKNKLFR